MVLKPKLAKPELTEKQREARLKEALSRIQSLEKIEDAPSKAKSQPIKGNKISKGTSLSADAKEALVASYYDTLRDRLNYNFGLPVWLSRQELSAQVQIFIDNRGGLRGYRFTKSSGNPQFDALVKKAVESSQPFPAPPGGLTSSLLADGISVGFPL
jgi:TonB family protein